MLRGLRGTLGAAFLFGLGLGVAPVTMAAQSSQFGVRGLGLPGRAASVEALGSEGASALFDPGSSRNPAAVGTLPSSLTSFSTLQEWRTSTNPAGTGSTRQQRFPLLVIGGPIPRSSFAVGVSYSTFANRDFLLLSNSTASPRGEPPIDVVDSLGSTGGLSDFGVALGYTLREKVHLGVGVHLITGTNRLFSNRAWSDTSYTSVRQSAELSYLGWGASVGALIEVTPELALAGSARLNGPLDVERDSTGLGSIDMPIALAGAVRWRPSPRLALGIELSTATWSRAREGIMALGGVGAGNTIEVAAGLEYFRNRRRATQFPLRVGVRHSELPFLLVNGSQPRELGVSIGTGFRFARDIGGVDLALERVHRKQGSAYSENAWHLSVGVSLRGLIAN
jgi:hypothetical protein